MSMIVIETVIMLNSFYNVLCLLHSIQFLVLSNPFLYFFLYFVAWGQIYATLSFSLSRISLLLYLIITMQIYCSVCVYVQTQTT